MSHRFTPKGGYSPPPPDLGKSFLVGSAIVLAGLSSFYMSMLYSKRKEQERGTNPMHEQTIASFQTDRINGSNVDHGPSLQSQTLTKARDPPIKQHNARHLTVEEYLKTAGSGDHRFQVPPPQRARGDGSGRAYTKSPDFVKNYEKTNHKIHKDISGRQVETQPA